MRKVRGLYYASRRAIGFESFVSLAKISTCIIGIHVSLGRQSTVNAGGHLDVPGASRPEPVSARCTDWLSSNLNKFFPADRIAGGFCLEHLVFPLPRCYGDGLHLHLHLSWPLDVHGLKTLIQ